MSNPDLTLQNMWGRLATCGRLSIGVAGFALRDKPIDNRPQDIILPHNRAARKS